MMNWILCATLGLAWSITTRAVTISESFSSNPLNRGWKLFGDTNLFHWDNAAKNLAVTWDSSQTNSYFYLPLGTILNRQDDFSLALDVRLDDVVGGIDPSKSSTFQLAFGFLNIVDAANPTFLRAAHSPNLVEFDFFPDTGFGPTIWPSVWSTNSVLSYSGSSDYTILDLPVGVVLQVSMTYTSSNRTLATAIATNGSAIGVVHNVKLTSSFTDFRVGTFAIESYSDAGQNPQYSGSLLAHGAIDNILIALPPPPIQNLSGSFVSNQWQASFISQTNWIYTLTRSSDFQSWPAVSPTVNGTGTTLTLTDSNAPSSSAFYRVRAERSP